MQHSRTIGERAIVIGAGIAGLVTARVLAERFEQVTIIERDRVRDGGQRKGAPQANHFHVLLRGGVDLLEQSFPGITEEMEADGLAPLDFARDLCWLQYGEWMPRRQSNVVIYPQTRSSLEAYIRRRLDAIDNIELLENTRVRALLATPDRKRVTGVETTPSSSAEPVTHMLADLVVDASGRGTRIFKWLEALGYERPEETRLPIDLCYASRLYEPTDEPRDWMGLWVSPLPPKVPRGGALQCIEGGRWVVSLFGYHGDHPPRDPDGFLAFAKTLLHPALHDTIARAKPVSDIHVFRVPEQRWSHVERMAAFPAGLLLIGDAYCNFDPVFGQGMSISLIEADTLRRRLRAIRSARELSASWAASYFRSCSRMIQGVWYFVQSEALRHPQLPGKRSLMVRFLQRYVSELYELNRRYPDVYMRFLRLMHLQSGPHVLVHPQIVSRFADRFVDRLLRQLAYGPEDTSASRDMPTLSR